MSNGVPSLSARSWSSRMERLDNTVANSRGKTVVIRDSMVDESRVLQVFYYDVRQWLELPDLAGVQLGCASISMVIEHGVSLDLGGQEAPFETLVRTDL